MATIKYWNGSAWELAIVGKQGPVGPTGPTGPAGSASLQRFRFVATGGETSLSGTDANGNTLAYTAGLEEVFLNGAALVRGQDYIATNGTSITSLAALTATDVVEILAWGVFNVANTISNTLVDAKGDLLVGSAADTVGRLAVGSNGTVLTADSAEATGVKWAAASGGSSNWTQIATSSASGSTITFSGFSGYNSLMLEIDGVVMSSGSAAVLHFRPNNISTSSYKVAYSYVLGSSTFGDYNTSTSIDPIFYGSSTGGRTLYGNFVITGCNSSGRKPFWGQGSHNDSSGAYGSRANSIVNGYLTEANAITSFVITTSGGFSSGTFNLWGSTN